MARSVTLLHFKVRKAWFIEQESGVNEVRTLNVMLSTLPISILVQIRVGDGHNLSS